MPACLCLMRAEPIRPYTCDVFFNVLYRKRDVDHGDLSPSSLGWHSLSSSGLSLSFISFLSIYLHFFLAFILPFCVCSVFYAERTRQHRWRCSSVTFHCPDWGLCQQWVHTIEEQLSLLRMSSLLCFRMSCDLQLPLTNVTLDMFVAESNAY